MNLRSLISLGKEVEKAQEAAHDLWSWLPSCKVAKKHHGDYYAEFTPNMSDVMIEAAMYMARVQLPPGEKSTELSLEEKDWFERCPCGESHDGSEE